MPTHSSRMTRQCSTLHTHHTSVSRSGNISFRRHEQVLTPASRFAQRPQQYATGGVWYAYDDKQKIKLGANSGSGVRQCWKPVEQTVVQLLGLMTLKMLSGVSCGSGDTSHLVNAKRSIPNGEASIKRHAKHLPLRLCQQAGEPFCS